MNLVTSIALALLGGIFAALAAFGGIRAAWRGLGRRRGVSAALAAFAVVATICAQKPSGPAITVDALLRDSLEYPCLPKRVFTDRELGLLRQFLEGFHYGFPAEN